MNIFEKLEAINHRPEPFERYTAADLWTDPHTSEQMLAYHLNTEINVSSRKGTFIDRSVEWICSQFNVGSGTRIADFGCGPGLYAIRLAQQGARITGIDFSVRSIKYAINTAKESGIPVNFVCQNYLEFETEDRFDLIIMIMCDYCALSPAQRQTMLEKFRNMLAPGGAVLLDVYSMEAFKQREEIVSYEENLLHGFWSAEKYYGFLNTFKYDRQALVLDKYTIVEPNRIRTVYNWLQHFSPESLKDEFRKAGFTDVALHGNVAGKVFDETAPEFAIVGKPRPSV
jgi:cyclopropane fatty-acyl-phospholipid synthase-like methyltransferase